MSGVLLLYGLSPDLYHSLDDNGSNLPHLTADEGHPKLESYATPIVQTQAIARYMFKN